MNTMLANHYSCDDSMFEETEIALAISPCPKIDELEDTGLFIQFAHKRSGIDRRRQTQKSYPAVSGGNIKTNVLAIVWVIALAIAVAIGIYVSGA